MSDRIRKIFKSFDFRNNKIIDAKVDTPSHNKHIANKEYVDKFTVYDTVKAQTYENPFQFPLVLNTFQKTIKQLFDDLFFPRVLPTFKNPILLSCKILPFNKLSYINGKYLSFFNQEIQMEFEFSTLDNDRVSSNTMYVKVTNPNTTLSTLAVELNGKFYLTFILLPGMVFEFGSLYDPITVPKQDSYGDDYIDPAFNLLYNLIVDITPNVMETFEFINSPLISEIRTMEGSPTYAVDTLPDGSDYIPDFDYIDTRTIIPGTEGIFDILIPIILIQNQDELKAYKLFVELFNATNSCGKTLLQIDSWLNYYTSNDTITLNSIEYFKYQINFGIFKNNMKFKLLFEK